eukprot:CAMPEP_0175772894 /NCGR_PEP_ID=MMETSP0097-20121207/72794_1 /TAXON_ID=311494 /ORGANISM="Alexandrium monilatum, Strain CCMP3105" /LENGTH=151 /DNA_ID=CAMNT_0017083281 /DNA_START=103 /DNA_END=555 /DNA_ORIENTATION=-
MKLRVGDLRRRRVCSVHDDGQGHVHEGRASEGRDRAEQQPSVRRYLVAQHQAEFQGGRLDVHDGLAHDAEAQPLRGVPDGRLRALALVSHGLGLHLGRLVYALLVQAHDGEPELVRQQVPHGVHLPEQRLVRAQVPHSHRAGCATRRNPGT